MAIFEFDPSKQTLGGGADNPKYRAFPLVGTTITAALQRITKLKEILGEIGDTSNLNLNVDKNSTLEDIVRAYNSIVLYTNVPSVSTTKQDNLTELSVDSSLHINVPSGYYKQGFTITGSVSSAILLELTALKETLTNLEIDPGKVLESSTGLKITPKADGTLQIDTPSGTIKEYAAKDIEVEIKKIENTTDDIITLVNPENLPAGYYKGLYIRAVVSKTTNNKVLNILTKSVDLTDLGRNANNTIKTIKDVYDSSTKTYKIPVEPSAGYDYLKSATVELPESYSSFNVTKSGNTIFISPINDIKLGTITGNGVTEQLDDNEKPTGVYIIPISTSNVTDGNALVSTVTGKDALGNDVTLVVVTPSEAYYNGSDAVPLKYNSDGTDTDINIISGIVALYNTEEGHTDEIINYKIPIGINLSPALTIGKTSLNVPTNDTVTSLTFDVTATAGYNDSNLTKTLTVTSAANSVLDVTKNGTLVNVSIKPATLGWFTGETIVAGADFVHKLLDGFANSYTIPYEYFDGEAELKNTKPEGEDPVYTASLEFDLTNNDNMVYNRVVLDVTELINDINRI